jgi:DNA-binding beta-propeller fold protein YncE
MGARRSVYGRLGAVSAAAGTLVVLLLQAAPAPAQPSPPKTTEYPRKNMTPWYEVDPGFFKRPAGVEWGETPGVAVDDKDQVWVFTRAKPPVQVYDSRGNLVRTWGEDVVGTAHYLKFDHEGMVWLADVGKHVVVQFTPEGKLLKTLGTPGKPGCDATHLNRPTDMVISPQGDVFVTDGYGNNRVVHFDKDGKFVKDWGTLGTGPGEFSIPHGITMDSKGLLYVADRNNCRVQVFDQSGKFLGQWRNLLVPWGFWISKKDEIWVCGSSPMVWRKEDGALGCPPKDQVFMRFDTRGKLRQLWTVPKGEDGNEQPGDLNWVHGIALDSKGNIYAGDIKGHRVQKFVRRR